MRQACGRQANLAPLLTRVHRRAYRRAEHTTGARLKISKTGGQDRTIGTSRENR
jgi:hypothetical protein